MDANFSKERGDFDSAETSDGSGKKEEEEEEKSVGWGLNDWKWDGHHFVATPLKNKQLVAAPSLDSPPSCLEETDRLGKRRKVLVGEDGGLCGDGGALSLKLGERRYPIAEGELENNGKRGDLTGGASSRLVCQVVGCGADLSDAKDYHRRHKVCEMHAKASSAMVGSVIQRFCQQCSRFQLLEEFDDGKRSCRRRLAGHNKRRRKTHPDTSISGSPLTDDKASSYLLISLLKILTDLHSDNSDKSKDQELVSHLLENIASLAGSSDSRNHSGTLEASQGLYASGTARTPSESANALLPKSVEESSKNPLSSPAKATCNRDIQEVPWRSVNNSSPFPIATLGRRPRHTIVESYPSKTVQAVSSQSSPLLKLADDVLSAQRKLSAESTEARFRINDFDLNCTYNETRGCGGCEQPVSSNRRTDSISHPSSMLKVSHQSSPPQTSGNSNSSSQSLSSSDGEAQSRTDRIVFKLFGKNPNDFPLVLRTQILDWLSHSPTDMESYIRPGCVVLTVYLRLDDSIWDELNRDLCSSLNRLLRVCGDAFWMTGWLYARIRNCMAFVYDGSIVLQISPLLLKNAKNCQIVSVSPVAVASSARVSFTVQGFNLAHPTARLLCAFEGKYLVAEATHLLVGETNSSRELEDCQYLRFSCSLPDAIGRGVIEVEGDGLSSEFFPFVVAEEDVCSEIRMLENSINSDDFPRNQAMNFLNEMGWLLRRSNLMFRSKQLNLCQDFFSLKRFRWLMTFAMDREWCAVVKKLMDIIFQGVIDLGGSTPSELVLSENLLHIAVRKKSKAMVKFLLNYKADTAFNETNTDCFLFRPDMLGTSNMTPLHIAASLSCAEEVLDALINDPGQYGIKAWKNTRDSKGFTPEDYAHARGHQSYVHLVQKKTDTVTEKGQVVLDIQGSNGHKTSKLTRFNIETSRFTQTQQSSCMLCDWQQLPGRSSVGHPLLHRSLFLPMVGIAAICVCVALLFKGPPEVTFVYPPFRWESLCYGIM